VNTDPDQLIRGSQGHFAIVCATFIPGNPYWRGKIGIVDLLIYIGCFVKKIYIIGR